MQKTLETIDPDDLLPVALARPLLTPPRTQNEGHPPLFAWLDPWTGALRIQDGELTIEPHIETGGIPCLGCLKPNIRDGDPQPECTHGRPVVLRRGPAIFIGTHLLGRFLVTGDPDDLPSKLWDVVDDLVTADLEGGHRSRWLLSPPIQIGGGFYIC